MAVLILRLLSLDPAIAVHRGTAGGQVNVLEIDEVVDNYEAAVPANAAGVEAALLELVMELRPIIERHLHAWRAQRTSERAQ
jgi:hypothetical protein